MGDSTQQKRLEHWIAQIIIHMAEGTGGLKLWIKDTGDNARREMIREYPVGADSSAERLALEIFHEATNEAGGSGKGAHKFTVYAFRSGETSHFQSTGFMLASEAALEAESEDTSYRGLLGDARRHVEAMAKINVGMFHSAMTLLDVQTRRLEAVEEREQIREQRASETAMARAKLEYDQESQKFLFDMIGKAAPGVLEVAMTEWREYKAKQAAKDAEDAPEIVAMPPQTVLPERAVEVRPRLAIVAGSVAPPPPIIIPEVAPEPPAPSSTPSAKRRRKK